MRKTLLTVLLGISLSAIGQTKRTELFRTSFGTGSMAVAVTQTKVEKDSTYNFLFTSISFQNQEYQHISDFKSVSLKSEEEVGLLISKLEDALAFSKSGEKSLIEFEDKSLKFRISVDGKNGRITLYSDRDTSGYTYIHPKNVPKMIETLKLLKENYGK